MEIEKVFRNTRIYDLDGDYEAIYSHSGWKTKVNHTPSISKAERGESEHYEENRKKTLQKAKSKIRRLVQKYKLYRFVTLTFEENMTDIITADYEFRKFMKRIARKFPDIQYVAVREFQQRGAVHYHLVINKYIPKTKLDLLWDQGYTWIKRQKGKNPDQLAQYLGKYISKHADDERLKGVHSYLRSHGLHLQVEDRYFPTSEDLQKYLASLGKGEDKQAVISFEDIIWIK